MLDFPPTRRLAIVERAHAAAMLLAAGLSLGTHDVRATAVVGAGALLLYVVEARGRWTPSGAFGAANTVTLVRAALVFAFACLGARAAGPLGSALVLAAFGLDGVDGWLARREQNASPFGTRLDTECDAWTVLVAALVLYLSARLGWFVLIAGLLRYAYVLLLALWPRNRGAEPPSRTGRWAFSLLMVSLCASLWPFGSWHVPLAMLATGLLCLSFVRSVVWSLGAVAKPCGNK